MQVLDHYSGRLQRKLDYVEVYRLDLGSPNSHIVQMVGGTHHLLILTNDNQLYTWGENSDSIVPKKLNNSTTPDGWYKLKTPGTNSWNANDMIDCGGYYCLALVNHGRELWGGGNNSLGELGLKSSGYSGWELLLTVGNLVNQCKEHNIDFPLRRPIDFLANNPNEGLENQRHHRITHISAGYFFWLVVLDNRYVFTCGEDEGSQLCRDNPNNVSDRSQLINEQGMLNGKNIKEIRAGFRYWMALTTDNQLYGCGTNSDNQLGFSGECPRLTLIDMTQAIPRDSPVPTIQSLLISPNNFYSSAFLSTDAKVYSSNLSEMSHAGDSFFNPTKESFITSGDTIQYANSHTLSCFVLNGMEGYTYQRNEGTLSPMDLSQFKLERGHREILAISCGYYGHMSFIVGKPVSYLHRHFCLMPRARKSFTDVEIITPHHHLQAQSLFSQK